MTEEASTDQNRDATSSIARRKFLEATSVSGLTVLGTQTVGTAAASSSASTRFGRLAVEASVSREKSEGTLNGYHLDKSREYALHDGSAVHLLQGAPESAVSVCEDNEETIHFEGFHVPKIDLASEWTGSGIPTRLRDDMRPIYGILPEEPYDIPSVLAQFRGELLELDGVVQTSVAPGESATVALPRSQVDVTAEKTLSETVDRPDIPKRRRSLKRKTWTESVEINPKVHIENYGQVDVVNGTDQKRP